MVAQLRQQIGAFWKKLDNLQRVILLVLVVLVAILGPVLINWARTPTYAIAFSGLSETDAGQIVDKLQADSIPYQLSNNTTILVPASQVYDVRLKMASAGLPQGGTVGFELFNGNTLGMTEFTQKVNYQQALQGEIERTIASLDAVQAVRVNIVTPEKSLLKDDQDPTTASVTIQEKPGKNLNAAQVRSITNLVASSVEGLKPENVVVVDVNGNMLAGGANSADSASQTDTQRAAELSAAKDIETKIEDLLNSALGPNKSVVRANVRMDWTQRDTTTQAYDPTSTIRSSQITTETYQTAGDQPGGIPGASSNLPQVSASSTISGSLLTNYNRNEKVNNYEITQRQTHEVASPGQIQNVSLAVLVDGVTDPTQLQTLKTVIGPAAGIDATRGDTLAVESLTFDHTSTTQQTADLAKSQQSDLYFRIGETAAAVIALLILVFIVQHQLSRLQRASAQAWTPVIKPVSQLMFAEGKSQPLQLQAQPVETLPLQPASAQLPALQEPKIPIKMPQIELPAVSAEDEHLLNLISKVTEENPASIAEIIQLWLDEDER